MFTLPTQRYFYSFAATALINVVILFFQTNVTKALSIEQIKQVAANITVLIPETFVAGDGQTKEANGSGVIVAKQGNVYTLLTAGHVVCRDPEGECKNYRNFKVVTNDNQEYEINTNTIKKLPGVDLVTLQFKSDKNYSIATLGNYTVEGEQFVFASGWPDPKFVGKREFFFNVGKVLPQTLTPILTIFPSDLGYRMVYTSVTYGGMSGGAVLDADGKVIAIHGRNEGDKIDGVRVALGFSVAIPITTFLQLNSQSELQGKLTIDSSLPTTLSLQDIGQQFYEGFEIPDKDNTNALDWLNYANKMWRLGQLAIAYSAYDQALKLRSDLYQSWLGKALVLTYWRKQKDAIAAYDQALKIQSDLKLPQSDIEWVQKLRDNLQSSSQTVTPRSDRDQENMLPDTKNPSVTPYPEQSQENTSGETQRPNSDPVKVLPNSKNSSATSDPEQPKENTLPETPRPNSDPINEPLW